jgi:hypothetical protein
MSSYLNLRLGITGSDLEITGNSQTSQSAGIQSCSVDVSKSCIAVKKFTLPRALNTSAGYRVTGIAVSYSFTGGPLSSGAIALSKILNSDGASSSSTVALTASTAFNTATASLASRAYYTVNSPTWDDSAVGATGVTVSYLLTVTLVNGATAASVITINDVEVLYDSNENSPGGLPSYTTVDAEATSATVTVTASKILGGIISYAAGAAASAWTLDSAANIVAAVPGCFVGQTLYFSIVNLSGNTITVGAGASGTLVGTATVLTLVSAIFAVRLTNTGSGTESYVAYRIA